MPPGRFRRGRRRGLIVGAAVGSAAARRNAREDHPQSYEQPTEGSDDVSELERLGELRDRGILTEEEFNEKKRQILGI